MKISTKGRYGIASMITLAKHNTTDNITIMKISKELGISKIYLEQVFLLLKRAGLVIAAKGAQGGYQLAHPMNEITVLDILSAAELSLLEETAPTVQDKAPIMEQVIQEMAFTKLDESIRSTLSQITLKQMVDEINKQEENINYMFYI